jgi:hypothetical protein
MALAREAKTYRAEAVVELPTSVPLGPAFLGLLKPAVIGGAQVHVVLPDFDASGKTLLHKRSQPNWVAAFKEKKGEDDPEQPFGQVYGWGEERELTAKRLLILPKERLTQRQASELAHAAEPWAELLHTWIEVVTREDLHQGVISSDEQGGKAFAWIDKGKGPGKVLGGRHKIILKMGNSPAITTAQWGKVLARASDGTRPPEAHVFLRDARHAKNIGHLRRSVLDSATAAELGLAKLRDDAIANSGARLAGYLRGRVRQIEGLSKFLSALGRNLPDRIREEISEPRNKAIHAGHEPDEETANKALGKAEEILDLAFPWKKLL